MAKCRKSKGEIKSFIETNFYDLDKTLDEIRPDYHFNETCQDTAPQAIVCFLERDSYEDTIRNAVSLGGVADAMGAITVAIAWAFYGRDRIQGDMKTLSDTVRNQYLLEEFIDTLNEFERLTFNSHD